MKASNYLIIFVSVILFLFAIDWTLTTKKIVTYTDGNRQYEVVLANACVDAMKVTTPAEMEVFNTKAKRDRVLNSFYSSLLKGLNENDGVRDYEIKEQTPFVLLIDNDGFYISYNANFDQYQANSMSAFTATPGAEVISSVTEINTWSATDGYGNIIRFYLNDRAKIIMTNGVVVEGSRQEVYDKMLNKYHQNLDYLRTKENYDREKEDSVILAIEEEINYLLNSQPISVGKQYKAYSVTLPRSSGEDWHRLLSSPCIISFLQGDVERNKTDVLDVFAYSGGEVIKSHLYYGESDGNYYRYNGGDKKVIGTMKELAEKGYNPAVSAQWDN